jgi:hypothetical protein
VPDLIVFGSAFGGQSFKRHAHLGSQS